MKILASRALSRLKEKGLASSAKYKGKRGSLFLFTEGGDTILSPSDDALHPVIGRVKGAISDIPPAMAAWLGETDAEITFAKQHPIDRKLLERQTGYAEPAKGRVTVQPLINALWGQGAPYNQNLKFGGKMSLVGCNAVSMSMVMLYWHEQGYNRGCKATAGYTSKTNGYKIPALAPVTVFDYVNMPSTKPETSVQKAAVAELCQRIGHALKSDYTPNGTLAYMSDCVTVFKSFLRMGSPKRIHASKGYDLFEQQIYEEIAAGRPVIMAGYTVNGAGHCFICDGYDASADMYHFNWGWGGSCNGWFKMTALDITSTRSYNSNKVAIVGIRPSWVLGDVNDDGVVDVSDASAVMDATLKGAYSERCDVNSDGKVTVTDAELVAGKALGKECL